MANNSKDNTEVYGKRLNADIPEELFKAFQVGVITDPDVRKMVDQLKIMMGDYVERLEKDGLLTKKALENYRLERKILDY